MFTSWWCVVWWMAWNGVVDGVWCAVCGVQCAVRGAACSVYVVRGMVSGEQCAAWRVVIQSNADRE